MARILNQLTEIANQYDAVFCDLWGVIHDGKTIFSAAAEALLNYRLSGGKVIFVTNSPRTPKAVARQLGELQLPDSAYDSIVSGGGVMQHTVFSIGLRSYYFIGRDEDREIFTDLPDGIVNTMVETTIDKADCLIVAGPDYDNRANARDYEIELRQAFNRRLPMYSANVDRIVDHGDERIECAGAIADLYIALGGTVFEFGKPFAGIYDAAIEQAARAIGSKIDRRNILVIGDSITTDIKGAVLEDFDVLFVASGLHANDIGLAQSNAPNADAIEKFLATAEYQPQFAIDRLR